MLTHSCRFRASRQCVLGARVRLGLRSWRARLLPLCLVLPFFCRERSLCPAGLESVLLFFFRGRSLRPAGLESAYRGRSRGPCINSLISVI